MMSDSGLPAAAHVTVGIATCGRPDALSRCLEALEHGSVVPGEVLIVDQQPMLETRAVVARSRLPRVRHLEQAREGVSAARNLALKSATGSIMAFTDDDCAPDPGWLEGVLAAFSTSPYPAAVTGPILAPRGARPKGFHAVSLRESLRAADHSGRAGPWHAGSGGNLAVRTHVLRARGGWDERLGPGTPGRAAEDAELLYRLLSSGATVRYEPAAVMRHDWQSGARLFASSWSYGFGSGALFGILIRRSDSFWPRLVADYLWVQGRELLGAIKHRNRLLCVSQARMLLSVVPGLIYGLRASASCTA